MTTIGDLSGPHRLTYQAIFQHPVSRNLEWRRVYSLLRHIGVVTVEANGHLKVVRNGHVLVLRTSQKKDVSEVSEIMELRHFLQHSGEAPGGAPAARVQWLLVIDHKRARIFRCDLPGSGAEVFRPPAPAAFFRYPAGAKEFSRGKEKPDANTYFGPVGDALKPPGQVLVFGRGTGAGSEMDEFVAWAKERRPILASQIVGAEVVDSQHLTDGEMVAKARLFLTDLPGSARAGAVPPPTARVP
jgi:hypothetical protein